MRLDHFERFVRKSRAVDRNLSTHSPRRMPQRIVECCRFDSVGWPITERTARRGQHKPADFSFRPSGNALQDRAVLAVDWNDVTATSLAGLGNERTPHDEGLLVRQRDALSAVERGERRVEPGCSDNRVEDNVDVRPHRCLDEALWSGMPVPAVGRAVVRSVVNDADVGRMEPVGLLAQQHRVRVGRQRRDAEPIGMTRKDA
jgi:hypothetical protein